MKTCTLDEVIYRLSRECVRAGSLRAYARKCGYSAAYLSDVINRHRMPGEKILIPLGLEVARREIITLYQKKA